MKPNPATIVTAGFLLVIVFIIMALFSEPKPNGQPGWMVPPVTTAQPEPLLSPAGSNPAANVPMSATGAIVQGIAPPRPVGALDPRVTAPAPPNRVLSAPPTKTPYTMAAPPVVAPPPALMNAPQQAMVAPPPALMNAPQQAMVAPLPALVGQAGADPTLKPFVNPKAKLAEGHWKGLEALPLSIELKKKLKLPIELEGLLIDEVTMNAAEAGLLAGDVIVAVNGNPVRSLEDLLNETRKVQMAKSASILVFRRGLMQQFMLVAKNNLGFAQVETAPMILPGEIMPHPYRGPCTHCHSIGTTGHIVPDPDGIILPPPPIRMGMASPHKDRGPCQACHPIIH
ncbi:MAG: magnetochrome domain-containing protein [Magnetococcales bacterium]|nr:magnetochrome domain-containing protein [Magnetococcales bacterium]